MRHFKNPNDNNKVYGFDETDPTQDGLIMTAVTEGWPEITGSWPPIPTAAEVSAKSWAAYQAGARAALMATDTTVARISEAISLGATTATTPDVVAFMQYRRDLRVILSQAQPATIPTALPTKPAYPSNT